MHHSEQYGDTLYPGRTVFKLHGPWAVKANFPGEYMITECHYNEDLRKHGILISPGISNFNLQHTLNAFLVFPIKDEDYTVTLKYGTPIMSLYPMHDRKFEVKMHKTDRKGFSDIPISISVNLYWQILHRETRTQGLNDVPYKRARLYQYTSSY